MVGDIGAPTGQIPLYQGNDVLDGGAFGDRMQGFSGDDIMLFRAVRHLKQYRELSRAHA